MIRAISLSDAYAICAIYNHYIANTPITFEVEAVSEAEMSGRIRETLSSFPWLVYEESGEVLGYAYASKWKGRSAYRYSAESTIYLRDGQGGRGIGHRLYSQLLSELRNRGLHCIIGGIALPNEASQRLHEKLGFKKVAHFEQVGWKFEKWIDVGYWQLTFSDDLPS
jgi:L-amino acid N-acyltransferase YncA